VYVEQARLDEEQHVTDSLHSFSREISAIETDGIYFILCSLRIVAHNHNIDWDPTVVRGIMLMGCRAFSNLAPIDNRNYMIFYLLDKLLDRLSSVAPSLRLERPPTVSRPAKRVFHDDSTDDLIDNFDRIMHSHPLKLF